MISIIGKYLLAEVPHAPGAFTGAGAGGAGSGLPIPIGLRTSPAMQQRLLDHWASQQKPPEEPPVPTLQSPPSMPDPYARRTSPADRRQRAGRTSTILTTAMSRASGSTYSSSRLGAA